jgi:type I restriction enzyme, R subunit
MASVLLPLKERAERIVKDLADKRIDAEKALDELASLAREREATPKSAKESGLSKKAFAAYWTLHEDAALYDAGAPLSTSRERLSKKWRRTRMHLRTRRKEGGSAPRCTALCSV